MAATSVADAVLYVVDDDEGVRESLRSSLELAGQTVFVFASAEEFLASFDPARRGCLIIDVQMPGMSGLDILRRFADQRIGIPVIVITGYGDVPMAVEAMRSGAADFIEKPFKKEVLLASVMRAMTQFAKRQPVDDVARQHAVDQISVLTPRETEIFERLVMGLRNKDIARELGISPRTVEVHRAQIFRKTGTDSLSHLVRLALAAGVVESH